MSVRQSEWLSGVLAAPLFVYMYNGQPTDAAMQVVDSSVTDAISRPNNWPILYII